MSNLESRARAFLHLAAGVFLLGLGYHLGARSAGAQSPGNPVVAVDGAAYVYTANGDVYGSEATDRRIWHFISNVFAAPTPAQRETWGGLKARYHTGGSQPSPGR